MRFTFNTGRRYTLNGQLITVWVNEERDLIFFHDHSRMIRGMVHWRGIANDAPSQEKVATYLMRCYDAGDYVDTTKSLATEVDYLDLSEYFT